MPRASRIIFPGQAGPSRYYSVMGLVIALGFLMMGSTLFSKGQAMAGLINGQLSPCPNTPNCVCSEDKSSSSYIAPFLFADAADSAWTRVKQAIVTSGGTIHTEERRYLLASFTTKWLRFVDDVELRMDADNQVIHVRSASRVGRSDFGVNRKRVEMLRFLVNKYSSGP